VDTYQYQKRQNRYVSTTGINGYVIKFIGIKNTRTPSLNWGFLFDIYFVLFIFKIE
jgi:hypothetical protein